MFILWYLSSEGWQHVMLNGDGISHVNISLCSYLSRRVQWEHPVICWSRWRLACVYTQSGPMVACCFVYRLANKNHCWSFWGLSLLNWGHALPKGTFLIMAEWQHVLFTFSALAFSTSSEMQHILYSLCLQNCLKNFTPVLP